MIRRKNNAINAIHDTSTYPLDSIGRQETNNQGTQEKPTKIRIYPILLLQAQAEEGLQELYHNGCLHYPISEEIHAGIAKLPTMRPPQQLFWGSEGNRYFTPE
jgi:hypothetical protein